ncbi:hypothetical protein ACFQXA_05555 [Nocardiopsis composta]
MTARKGGGRLGVGIAGSGFIADFHTRAFRGVRDADVTAVCGRTEASVRELCDLARRLRVGDPTPTPTSGRWCATRPWTRCG